MISFGQNAVVLCRKRRQSKFEFVAVLCACQGIPLFTEAI